MKNVMYICPSCKGQISVNENIVLIIKDYKGNQGIAFLHTELGNYTSQMTAPFEIKTGDVYEFFCPYCHSNLEYHKDKTNLASIIRVDSTKKETLVVFSKIYGEQSTYHIDDNSIKSYGMHAIKYMDPEWYLK